MTADPLARLSQAEKLLAEATDITELMELRSMAKAAEAAAVALGLADIAQHAKVFQLRAERKAGGWLTEHVRVGRPEQSSHDGRVFLADLEIDHHTSSRWQTIAAIPEPKFQGYIDEHISKGWEVSAGGLQSYARNLAGKPSPERPGRGIYLVPPPGLCALVGYKVVCRGPLTGQHVLDKSKARGNEEVRAILVSCPEEIMVQVCLSHNSDRWADTKDAQRILLLHNIYRFGWARMKAFFDSLPWKVTHPELTLEGILG
jgi:hypothetical protein